MRIRTPAFWYDLTQGRYALAAVCLRPVSWLYGLGRLLHCAVSKPQRLDKVHVICLGNLNAGGAGKTPSALAVMKLIDDYGLAKRPAFVMRGYGAALTKRSSTVVLVDVDAHSAADVGEEALLLAKRSGAAVYIGRDRYAVAQHAACDGADVIVLDDGLQNRKLAADTYMLVVDKGMVFGNGLLLPAGPLREPISAALARVHASIAIGADADWECPRILDERIVFGAQLDVRSVDLPPSDARYFAFCGIGYPRKFYDYLRGALGLNVVQDRSFPDHYAYSVSDVASLQEEADKQGLSLITTEKDIAQLQRLVEQGGLDGVDLSSISVLPVSLHFDDEAAVLAFLRERLSS